MSELFYHPSYKDYLFHKTKDKYYGLHYVDVFPGVKISTLFESTVPLNYEHITVYLNRNTLRDSFIPIIKEWLIKEALK